MSKTHLQYELSQSTQCHIGGAGPRHLSSSHSIEASWLSSSLSLSASVVSESDEISPGGKRGGGAGDWVKACGNLQRADLRRSSLMASMDGD